ncbi:MAG: phosphate ABC transporter permease [Pseudomonadota bacterium]
MSSSVINTETAGKQRLRQWRMLKNRLFGTTMAVGGISVIVAILLIFFYLFWVVVPLFVPPKVDAAKTFSLPLNVSDNPVVHLSLEEYAEIAFILQASGDYSFLDAQKGSERLTGRIKKPGEQDIVAVADADPATRMIFMATRDGNLVAIKPEYALSYPNDVRHITPSLTYPLGESGIAAIDGVAEPRLISGQGNEEEITVAVYDSNGRLTLIHVAIEESFLDEEVSTEVTSADIPLPDGNIKDLDVDIDQRELFIATDKGELLYFDIEDKSEPRLVDRVVTGELGEITELNFLAGGISILTGTANGSIAQWFPVRDSSNNYRLEKIRSFVADGAPVTFIRPEYFRKGFASADEKGTVSFFHTTSEQKLMSFQAGQSPLVAMALGPRANALLTVQDDSTASFREVHNEHPEISFKSLWQEVWYESRSKPEYIWQSSSASSDFEPKFSLTPLTFGTIKAAFYAMLFAMPLAILGAVYTAYFMTPKMRSFVKPSVEVMAALPTVILGFLAGLWLAPLVELYLPGVFIATIFVPLSFILASAAFQALPQRIKFLIPNGWEAALLIPLVIFGVWFSFLISPSVETMFFDGNMPAWVTEHLGLAYDQRNSLVVGMAIGFAVIPTIFSISEDAVFGVPKHLTTGSLALGATPWQTVVGVVLLTASPGIFSAVMIGLGRAVGETMIVLMATGNTPIMDANIFQGFRALSANIAVEMPESEVNSSHYRILFLAALVLFTSDSGISTAIFADRARNP